MKKIAFINHKGGVGKTASAVNLAYNLSVMGKKVCLLDLDPQGDVSKHLGLENCKGSCYEFLGLPDGRYTLQLKEMIKEVHTIDVLPSSRNIKLASDLTKNNVGRFNLLKRSIDDYQLSKKYDYLIIDCPTQSGFLINTAMVASDIIIPVQCKHLPLEACKETINIFSAIESELKGFESKILGLLPTFFNLTKNESKNTIELLLKEIPFRVFHPISDNTTISEASKNKMPIEKYNKQSKGACDYRELTMEILDLN